MRVVVRLVQAGVLAMVVIAGINVLHRAPRAAAPVAHASGEVVIGPAGVGKLALGMSEAQATATGQVRVSPDWKAKGKAKCLVETVDDTSLHFSRHYGLALITVPDHFRTPEGIRAGASLAAVAIAYPQTIHPELGSSRQQVQMFGEFAASVPDNPDAIYTFVFGPGARTGQRAPKLRYVLLSLLDQGEECTHAT